MFVGSVPIILRKEAELNVVYKSNLPNFTRQSPSESDENMYELYWGE